MLAESIGWGLAVGGTLLAGAVVASLLQLPGRVAAAITAFGGGILLAAVALELVPEADERAGLGLATAGLLAGVAIYIAADAWLSRDQGKASTLRAMRAAAAGRPMPMRSGEEARGEAIAAGLFIDGVPESVALGLTIAQGELGLALLVGILAGNVAEAYGAAQPIIHGGRTARFAVLLLGSIGLALAGSTVLGATVLAEVSDSVIGFIEALAAGAVLGVLTISVIPNAFQEVSRWVAAATVTGFVAGFLLS